jgi:hypothetical protein
MHRTLLSLAAASLLLPAACTAREPPPETGGLPTYWKPSLGRGPARSTRVEISWVAPRPTVGSGTIPSYYKFTARRISRNRRGRNLAYFRLFMGRDDVLPEVGESCDVVYRFDEINGFGVGGNGLIRRGRFVTDLACSTSGTASR